MRSTHLNKVIKSHDKFIHCCLRFKKTKCMFTENYQHIQKIINMQCGIKTCKHNIIVMAIPSIGLSGRKSTC